MAGIYARPVSPGAELSSHLYNTLSRRPRLTWGLRYLAAAVLVVARSACAASLRQGKSVLEGMHVVLDEEWAHHGFCVRDLDLLEK
jgi:hypothetical protein